MRELILISVLLSTLMAFLGCAGVLWYVTSQSEDDRVKKIGFLFGDPISVYGSLSDLESYCRRKDGLIGVAKVARLTKLSVIVVVLVGAPALLFSMV